MKDVFYQFKHGDKILIKNDIDPGSYSGLTFTNSMLYLCGELVEVDYVDTLSNGWCEYKLRGYDWWVNNDMIEVEESILINEENIKEDNNDYKDMVHEIQMFIGQ